MIARNSATRRQILMAAAGRIVESMNRNIDAMEQEKSILRKLARLSPEQAPSIRAKIDAADAEIATARKRIERYRNVKTSLGL